MAPAQLQTIHQLQGTLELITGLHIGSGESEMQIIGTDNPVMKHPYTGEPYIPGSSLKGKMRNLLEWRSGAVQEKPLSHFDFQQSKAAQRSEIKHILQLFGVSSGERISEKDALALGPTRLAFWDCALQDTWRAAIQKSNRPLTETKGENVINRISGIAEHPRNIERVPAGAQFMFRLSLKRFAEDDSHLLDLTLQGLKLLELDGLGGSVSRGYGKLRFLNLTLDDSDITDRYQSAQPFPASR